MLPAHRATKLVYIPLVLAGWLRYLVGVDDRGDAFELSPDPNIEHVRSLMGNPKLGDECPEAQLYPLLANRYYFGVNLFEIGVGETVVRMFNGLTAVRAQSADPQKYCGEEKAERVDLRLIFIPKSKAPALAGAFFVFLSADAKSSRRYSGVALKATLRPRRAWSLPPSAARGCRCSPAGNAVWRRNKRGQDTKYGFLSLLTPSPSFCADTSEMCSETEVTRGSVPCVEQILGRCYALNFPCVIRRA